MTGLLFWLGTGLVPVPWLTWVAPLPALLAAPRLPVKAAAGAAFVGYLLGLAGYGHYLLVDLETPVPAVLFVLTGLSTVFVAVVGLFRALIRRQRVLLATLATPAAWASAEYLMAHFGPYGANWSLANAQVDLLPVLQVASVTGVSGVSFLIFAAASAVAAASAPGVRLARRVLPLIVAAALVGTGLGYGLVRLSRPPETADADVDLVAVAGTGQMTGPGSPGARSRVDADLSWLYGHPLVEGRIIVFPEKDVPVDERTLPGIVQRFRTAAGHQQATIVLGLEQRSGVEVFNTALVFPPDGAAPSTYHKQFPVTGAEDEVTPGSELLLVPIRSGIVGVAICADLDHPALGRRYARAGAGLLAVPALDFQVDDWSQSRVQLLRGVESGFATARAARQGYLTVADRYGRVRAERRTDDLGRATVSLTQNVPLGAPTPYARLGDVFSWLCLGTTCAACLTLATRRRPPRRERPSPLSPSKFPQIRT